MAIPPVPPRAFGPLLRTERARLLETLGSIEPSEWDLPSPCPVWSVLGLAAHLLGDDLSLLAAQRDGHLGTPAPDGAGEQRFIAWLDGIQVEWVHAARRLSPRLVTDLLAWTGDQVVELVAGQDASAPCANVSWASAAPVPAWLEHARELSERWLHRQQLLQALGRPSDLRPDLCAPVLDGLRWAYPFRLGAQPAPAGSTVAITVTGPEVAVSWTLVSDGAAWRFDAGTPGAECPVVAELEATTEQAWRLLSNNLDPAVHGDVCTSGDPGLVAIVRLTRAIIGAPK